LFNKLKESVMPESKKEALIRAREHGFKASSVQKGEKGHYILPHGIEPRSGAAKAYLSARDSGKSPESAAKIANYVKKRG
jgi:hypothetical protein